MSKEISLRDYQREAVDSIYHYFRAGNTGNPLIVAPTGSGKSILIAKFMQEVVQKWPHQRILMLAHRKELLQQNYSKLVQLWPSAPAGVYSAGLNSRQLGRNITIAGIASIYKKANNLGWQDLIVIDECHLVPSGEEGEGMYRKIIQDLLAINKNLKVLGFTATPYRMKTGMLIEPGGIFTDIAYEIDVGYLVKMRYLSPLVSKIPKTQADLSQVRVRGGEFVAAEAERAMDDEALTQAAIDEMELHLRDRKSWIIFCAGVEHAFHVTKALNDRGHTAECVVGESEDMFRAATLRRFKEGQLKCLVNCDVLTTGFDAPNIDALVLLRPTKSVGLYVQMCGRGMRLSPETGKENCIVLDFAGNIERHGPIDAVKIQRKSGGGDGREVSTAPVKSCPQCDTAVAISVKKCPTCGYEFPVNPKHDAVATTKEIMVTIKPPQKWNVSHVDFARHEKAGKAPSLRVTYHLSGVEGNLQQKRVSEWVCLEHRGFAYQKAVSWWLENHHLFKTPAEIKIPMTVDEALEQTWALRPVREVFVQEDGKFERVVSRVFGEWVSPFEEEEEQDHRKPWEREPHEPVTTFDDDDIPF